MNRQTGFTYLAALFLIAIMSAGLAAVGIVWHTAQQREKERELLFIGEQFRTAIGLYYEKTPGTIKRYPASLDNLLKDERQLSSQRYLRKIYLDPLTREAKWGLIAAPAPGGGIMGVHSLSEEAPIKSGGFGDANKEFEGKEKYSGWKFVYQPVALPVPVPLKQPGQITVSGQPPGAPAAAPATQSLPP